MREVPALTRNEGCRDLRAGPGAGAPAGFNGERHRDRFLVKLGSKLLPVQAADVAYFCSMDGATELHTHLGKRYASTVRSMTWNARWTRAASSG